MIQQRNIAKYVFLEIITLGIYGLFFWSDWTEDVNKICEDDEKDSANYILVFILDIFTLGIYSFAWNYIMSERMYRIAPQYGIQLKHNGSYILLLRTILFFLPVVGTIEKLKMFNALAVAYNASLDGDVLLETMQQKKSKKELKAEKKANKKAVSAPVVEAPVEEPVATEEPTKKENEGFTFIDDRPEPRFIPTEYPAPFEAPKFEAMEAPVVEEAPIIEEAPIVEEAVIEETPIVETPVADKTSNGITFIDDDEPDEPFVPEFLRNQVEITSEPIIEEPVIEINEAPQADIFAEPTYEIVEEPTIEPVAEAITFEEIAFTEPTFEVVEEPTFTEPTFEVVEEPTFTEPTFEVVEEPVVEIKAEPEFIDFKPTQPEEISFEPFSSDLEFNPVETEAVEEVEIEPVVYEIPEELEGITFTDEPKPIPASKEDVLKNATKTVGTKRTVKEKVAKEPAAKKSTKTAEEKATKATPKKDTATKSTTKSTKTAKAPKEKAKKDVDKILDEIKIDDLSFGEISFGEVDLGDDILNEIAEISKSKK